MKRTLLKLMALLALFSLIAAACGDDDDESTSTGDEAAEEEAVEEAVEEEAADEEAAEEAVEEEAADEEEGAEEEAAAAADEECVLPNGVSDTEIKFGSSMPLTGNLAALGADATFALDLTVDRINDAGGINGRQLTLITQDDEYNPEKTTANSQYFIEREEVFGVWGSIGSATMVAAIPLHDEAGVLTLFPWAQDLSLFDVEAHPLFFSVNPSAYAQTLAYSDYIINESGLEDEFQVGLMTINSVDGEQTVQGFKDGAAGEFLVSEQTYERDSTTYGPQIIAFQDAGVTDVYVGTGDTAFAQFLQEADQLGLEARIWGSSGTVTSNSIELAGDLSEGQYGVTITESATADAPGIVQFREDMLAAGAEEAQLGTASLLAYTGGLVLEEALNRAGDCLTTESFVAAMESIEDFDTGGIMPPLTFTSENHLGNNGVVIFQVEGGEWVRIN